MNPVVERRADLDVTVLALKPGPVRGAHGIAMLADAEWPVRREAAVALGQIGPAARKAAPVLSKLIQRDPNTLVRKAARAALARVRTK